MSKEEVEDIKTLAQLVKRLNRKFCDGHANFYIKRNDDSRTGKLMFDTQELVYFQPIGWFILNDMPSLDFYIQHFIMDFCYYSNPDYWFSKKRYNIIIANCTDGAKTYWKKDKNDFITFTTQDNKTKASDFVFTKYEIEVLKSKLSETMAKIVDLGKVEVTDKWKP